MRTSKALEMLQLVYNLLTGQTGDYPRDFDCRLGAIIGSERFIGLPAAGTVCYPTAVVADRL